MKKFKETGSTLNIKETCGPPTSRSEYLVLTLLFSVTDLSIFKRPGIRYYTHNFKPYFEIRLKHIQDSISAEVKNKRFEFTQIICRDNVHVKKTELQILVQ